MMLDGRAQESGIKRRGSDATLLLIYNAHYDVVNFTLPSVAQGQNWIGLIDTNEPDAQLATPFFRSRLCRNGSFIGGSRLGHRG